MKYKNQEVHICFSRHKNEALRIDIVSQSFERLDTCTIATDAYRKYQDQHDLSENENRNLRVRHLLNLIAGLDLKKPKAIALLQECGILEKRMAYREKVRGRDVGYYHLTENAIDQKSDIVDEDERYDAFFSKQVRQYFKYKDDVESTENRRIAENKIRSTGFPVHFLQEGKKEQVVKKLLYFRKQVK
ncbi:hypothetical protein HCA69_15450 [Listeria grandensis]|uniref:Uncharacterized protein n=1 Tax=Listeria grandensis TaxID=1494963 RepID=A0A7X1CR69_9LIST|nr:hypothetical protein [Listeria grandensis]MBC1937764.1 hypothetical protein [Listeria grandensis]